MASKLSTLTTSYHSFQKDQVLTETQLNEFLNYFDDQTRLSRVMLSGVGLACGFEVRYDTPRFFSSIDDTVVNTTAIDGPYREKVTANMLSSEIETKEKEGFESLGNEAARKSINPRIIIKQGIGVTTDGDILQLIDTDKHNDKHLNTSEIAYTHYRKFTDENAHYQHFSEAQTPFNMWELLPSAEVTDTNQEKLISTLPKYDQMVVLLYLESYQNEGDLCADLSCDNQGIEEVAKLRVLLVSPADAQKIVEKDSIYNKHDLQDTYSKLADLAVKRVIYSANNSSQKLSDLYWAEENKVVLESMMLSLGHIQSKIGDYLPNNLITSINMSLLVLINQQESANRSNTYFQYNYDFLKDLVDTYNELKECFIDIASECLPDLNSFPKHLMLGLVQNPVAQKESGRFRHKFYKSALFETKENEYKNFLFLLNRLKLQLVSHRFLPNNSSVFNRNSIKITPSNLGGFLGNKAIPFYYDASANLINQWNLELSRKNKSGRNLSYHTNYLDEAASIQTPLLFGLENKDFLRIEGHQGKDLVSAMTQIDLLKKENGLAFDVKAVYRGDDESEIIANFEDYSCHFEDLQVMLEAWSLEQTCSLKKATTLLSSFSITSPGVNLSEAVIKAPIGVELTPEYLAKEFEVAANSEKITEKEKEKEKMEMAAELLMKESAKSEYLEHLTYKTQLSAVDDAIVINNSTVGGLFNKSTVGRATDPVSLETEVRYNALSIIRKNGVKWDDETRDLLIMNPIKLLAYILVIEKSIPSKVEYLNEDLYNAYVEKVDELCSAVKQAKLDLAEYQWDIEKSVIADKVRIETNIALLEMALDCLSDVCCTKDKFKAILDAKTDRITTILEHLSLDKFVEKHPGLEHFGGVKPGGTFVLVYDVIEKSVNVNGRAVKSLLKAVVADFSLPYMCCSDCMPVNFIVEQPKVKLRLPQSRICLENEALTLTFQVEPVDGKILSDREINGMTIDENTITFDPNLFPQSELNTPIEFTVNQQLTDCVVQVGKYLDASFTVPESPSYATSLDFATTENLPSGTTYLWNFDDGVTSTLANPQHDYLLPAGTQKELTVTLTVTPPEGGCVSFHSEDLTIIPRAMDISRTKFCADNTTAYEINTIPIDAGAITWNGGSGNQFVPSEANPDKDGTVIIYADGDEIGSIKICPALELSGEAEFNGKSLKLTHSPFEEAKVVWALIDKNDNAILSKFTASGLITTITSRELSKTLEEQEIRAVLIVINDCCEKSIIIDIVKKTISEPVKTCTQYALDSLEDLENLEVGRPEIVSFMANKLFSSLTEKQQALFAETSALYDLVIKNIVNVHAGTQNTTLMPKIEAILTGIKESLQDVTAFQRTAMIKLYEHVMRIYLAAIQCQEKEFYASKSVAALLKVIYADLDPESKVSFSKSDIDIDPNGTILALVTATIPYRPRNSQSVIDLANWKGYLTN